MAKNTSSTTDEPKPIKILTDRLSVAQSFSEKMRNTYWKRVLKALDLKMDVTEGSVITTKATKYALLWGAYDNYLSELTSTPAQMVIDYGDKEDGVKQAYWKGIVDRQKRKLHIEDLREDFAQSLIVTGVAIYKVGRIVRTEKVTKEAKDPKTGKVLVKAEDEVIVENKSFVDVVDPRRCWLSPETIYKGPILDEDCPYIIEEMVKSPEYIESHYQVKVQEREKEIIHEDDLTEAEKKESKEILEGSSDFKRVRLYAYYGYWTINGKLEPNAEVIFTKKRVLKARKLPYAHGKKPYIVIFNFKKFFKPLANGSLDAVLDLDKEYNEMMNKVRTYIRRLASPKWAKLKGAQVDEAALLDPDVGVVVDESKPNSFRPVEPPKLDPAIIEKATSVEQLFQFLTGTTYGPQALIKAGTATGQGIAERGSDTKIGRIIRKMERSDEELYTMLLQLEQQYAPSEGVDIKITGSEIVQAIKNKKFLYKTALQQYEAKKAAGQITDLDTPPVDEYENFSISGDGRKVYTHYKREDIEGEFELSVVSQSSNRSNRAVKSQQAQNALNDSVNDPLVNRAELWRRKFYLDGWDDPDNLVNGQPVQTRLPVSTATPPAPEAVPPTETKIAADQTAKVAQV